MSCNHKHHRRDFLKRSLLALGTMPLAGAVAAADSKTIYVCPPCGCPSDGKEFAAPGECPSCGMTLVDKSTLKRDPEHAAAAGIRVAVLVFDGVQIIDFAAPYEVFGEAGYQVFTVGPSSAALTTTMSLTVTPRYSLAAAPPFDVLVVPGGAINAALRDTSIRDFIRARSAQSKHTLSVCNGAFLLAHAGLLNGLKATTYHGALTSLREHDNITVVAERRFADNGRVITSAGLSSGIDGALHVVSKLSGAAAAQLVALNMEYDWKEDGSYVRAMLADFRFLHGVFGARMRLDLGTGYEETLESTRGTRTAWEVSWQVRARKTPGELLDAIVERVGARSGLTARIDPGQSRGTWSFKDEAGDSWTALLTTSTAEKETLRAQLRLSRAT
jgi:putative intracellular protease/amidase